MGGEGGAQRDVGEAVSKPAPARVEIKSKKAAGKGESSYKKVQTKGERRAKGQQAEVDNRETKEASINYKVSKMFLNLTCSWA